MNKTFQMIIYNTNLSIIGNDNFTHIIKLKLSNDYFIMKVHIDKISKGIKFFQDRGNIKEMNKFEKIFKSIFYDYIKDNLIMHDLGHLETRPFIFKDFINYLTEYNRNDRINNILYEEK